MPEVTLNHVLQLAEKLTPEEQRTLIARLEAEVGQREASQRQSSQQDFQKTFDLLIFDPGPWPAQLTLRREDEYGDDEH